MADTNWWWNLGTSLCSWEQKTVYGILPQRIISAQELQNQKPCWKSHIDCILRLWRCCAHWLPGKRCYSELRTLQWNPYYIKEREKKKKKSIMRKEAETDDILLQHGNARPHTSAVTTDTIANFGFTVLPHQAYSPDLTPDNFHLFPKHRWTTPGSITSVLMKSRLQYTSSFI